VLTALGVLFSSPVMALDLVPSDEPLTRRDLVHALYPLVKRMESQGAIARTSKPSLTVFADLSGSDRDRAIELASQFHLFVSMPALSSGRFNGMLPLSRWEAGMILGELLTRAHPEARARLAAPGGPTSFTDLSPAEYRRLEPVIKQGLLIGYPDQTFRTQEPLTRAQWVGIAERLSALGSYQAPAPAGRKSISLKDDYMLIRQESGR
jgi:hypothetical protein